MKQRELKEARRKEKRSKKKKRLALEPDLTRKIGSEEIRKNILIVSEGVNTEKSYFNQFHIPGIKIHCVGRGTSTCRLITDVAGLLKGKYQGCSFDEIWVVFDKDDNDDFKEAIKLAQSLNYRVAYSNQAFEYWLLLHFYDHQGGAIGRKDYSRQINSKIHPKAIYDEKKIISPEFFNMMLETDVKTGKSRLLEATERAKRIYENKEDKTEESVTTVFQLIESINPPELYH